MSQIGLSFNPEHWNLALYSEAQKLELLKYCIYDLNINNIRFSLRWEDVELEPQIITLEKYKPYLDLLADTKTKLVLNIGPVKTMRWPEEPIPRHVLSNIAKPNRGELLTAKSPLADPALKYLKDLLQKLSLDHPNTLKNLYAIQLDNEPFNVFGQYGYNLSIEWVISTLEILHTYLPNAKILLNSNGRADLRKIKQVIEIAKTKFPDFSWIIGINYYWQVPIQHRIPIINKLDNLSLSFPWNMSISNLKKFAKKENIEIEISEFQGEPWQQAQIPGNNFKEISKRLEVVTNKVLVNQQGIIRYWGIEYLLDLMLRAELNQEHKKILEFIKFKH